MPRGKNERLFLFVQHGVTLARAFDADMVLTLKSVIHDRRPQGRAAIKGERVGRFLMSSQITLVHRTCYRYDRPVVMGPQTVRLRPMKDCRTPVLSYTLKVEPAGAELGWGQDDNGNETAFIRFDEKVTHFNVEVSLVADMRVYDPLRLTDESLLCTQDCDTACRSQPELGEHATTFINDLRALLPEDPARKFIKLNEVIARRVRYERRMEPGVLSAEDVLSRNCGSCRDSAWLMVLLARHMGFAARFVSGYLVQSLHGAGDEEVLNGDLHAWAQVLLPEHGWLGFDTTSGRLAGEGHIPLAVAAEPEGAAPISGLLDRCESCFDVSMQVQRLFS